MLESVKDRVLRLCAENGVRIGTLEKNAGMSNGTISKWKENTVPNGATLAKISAYFGVTVDYLISDEPKPEKENTEDAQLRAEIMKSIDGMSEVDLKTVLAMSKVIAERQKEKEKDEK